MELRVGEKYIVKKKIGGGAFGRVYIGTHAHSREEVAIKMEEVTSRHPQLLYEARVYRLLQGHEGVAALHWHGVEAQFNVMVTELLGPSLEDLFAFCARRFSLKTVLMLAEQMLARLEYVHSKNVLHRDVKPDNFLVGLGRKAHLVHLIDFGLAKKFKDSRSGQHIPYREGKKLTGTACYASLATHLGVEQSRRDDLESLAYVFIYFLKGQLPWQGVRASNKQERYDKIKDIKLNLGVATLCEQCPPEFTTYLSYCRSLGFEDQPDYAYLNQLFNNLFLQQGYEHDFVFDWNSLKVRKPRNAEDSQAS